MVSVIEEFHNATLSIGRVVEGIPSRMKELNTLETRYNNEILDLEHLAEFETFNAAEGFYIAKQIQKARKKRRSTKDEIEVLMEIKKVANCNSKLDNHMKGLDKQISELIKRQETRKYSARVRTDLQSRFVKCESKRLKGG